MAAALVSILVLIFKFLPVTSPLQWSPDLPNGQTIRTCQGQNVSLNWSFSLDPGDVVTSVKWTFSGLSQEMIALYVPHDFLPTPVFAHRVTHLPEAGLLLSHVTSGDGGNYTVEVVGHDVAGTSFTFHRWLLMQVTDVLTGGALDVRQLAVAEYSNSTEQWHAVLTCGNFTFTGDPPFSVEWQLPSGSSVPSSYYRDGSFHLLLPNPVSDGNYSCRLPPKDPCVRGNGQQVWVRVDSLTTRLALVEGRQTTLQAENRNLKEQVTHLQQRNDVLEGVVHKLQGTSSPNPVAFQAMMETAVDPWSGGYVNFQRVMVNIGGAYNSSNGRFTASINGTYYFSALSTPGMKGRTGSLKLVTNAALPNATQPLNSTLAVCSAFNVDTPHQSSACQTVVTLHRGEQVWLETVGDDYYAPQESSGFSGFLLFAQS